MRKISTLVLGACALVVLGALVATTAADVPDLLGNRAPAAPAKDPGPGGPVADPPDQRVGGDTCANPTVIPSLPYTDAASTTGFTHDYEEVCPYNDTAPDVVYSYQPAADEIVSISVCDPNTTYDSKLYVYEGSCPDTGNPFACDDDGCASPGLASELLNLVLTGGTMYYIVVDGYGTANGDYVLTVTSQGAPPTCPCNNGTPENELDCGLGAGGDTVNGGCNTDPNSPPFIQVSCGETICGSAGSDLVSTRDTDWYNLILPIADNVTVTLTSASSVPIDLYEITGEPDCVSAAVGLTSASSLCVPGSITFAGVAGDNWIWVGTSDYYSPACPTEYTMTVECEIVPVELQSLTLE